MTSTPGSTDATPFSFVCCVEAGRLEPMTVRLADSLRRYGGKYAKVPFYAVTPRQGPSLSRETLRRFDALDVRYIRAPQKSPYTWYHFYNKPLALKLAEEQADTPFMAWLDCDLLVLDEPEEFALEDGYDFIAAAPGHDIIGTTGPGDPHEPHWAKACEIVDVGLYDLPWITAHVTQRRIRLYWQAGVFGYRRDTGLAADYLHCCDRLLDAGFGLPANGVHWLEQMALGFAMVRKGLAYTELPESHNYAVASYLDEERGDDVLEAARVLHYHDAMDPGYWDRFLSVMRHSHPEPATWLEPQGPILDPQSRPVQLAAKLLRGWRLSQRRRHESRSPVR
ncbi:MAG: hypothetical protein AAF430_21795 [Myxococcota bacterium]